MVLAPECHKHPVQQGALGGGSGLGGCGVGELLTPGQGLGSFTQAAQICASDFASAELSSPIVVAGAHTG